jgi:hypothetical protein
MKGLSPQRRRLMPSGERSRVDAERSFPRVGEEDPGASNIFK